MAAMLRGSAYERCFATFRVLNLFGSTESRRTRSLPSFDNRASLRKFYKSAYICSKQLSDADDVKQDEPIKYSTSSAQTHSSYDTFFIERSAPWYQTWIVLGSSVAFLLYFLVLREENDLDEEIGKSLFERIPGLEEQDLKAKIANAKEMGLESNVYETRLMEIKSNK